MLGSLSRSILTLASTAMIFNSSSHAQYIRVILAAKLLSSTLLFGQVVLTRRICVAAPACWLRWDLIAWE